MRFQSVFSRKWLLLVRERTGAVFMGAARTDSPSEERRRRGRRRARKEERSGEESERREPTSLWVKQPVREPPGLGRLIRLMFFYKALQMSSRRWI